MNHPTTTPPSNGLTQREGFGEKYKNKKILVTGHTGFKGSWLTQWLLEMEATVCGYSLAPPTNPSLFEQLNLAEKIQHQIADIRNFAAIKECVASFQPDIVFHLAAQPLVRESYETPLETVEVNTLGTAYLLEAVRQANHPMAVVAITTDKCYENKEWVYGYRESDPMGGYDPYSASKGAAELLIASWRNSFFPPAKIAEHGVRLASVRAGNVIGGGDWAKDRIMPDCIKSLCQNELIEIRNPQATRPWQHVLEPLEGYLLLGARLLETDPSKVAPLCSAFNFGPSIIGNRPVAELVETVIQNWGGGSWYTPYQKGAPHEATLLHLNIDKAYHLLNWQPKWTFEEAVRETTRWYKTAYKDPVRIPAVTIEQIHLYQSLLIRQQTTQQPFLHETHMALPDN